MFYPRITILIITLLSFSMASAQTVIKGKSVENRSFLNKPVESQYPKVKEMIKDFAIYQIDISKSDISVSPANPLVNLQLDNQTFELNLFQDNLTTTYKKPNQPLLLGGSLTKGGSVSLTINDDFIYGFIKYGSQNLYIEPLHYLDSSAPKGLYAVYDAKDVIADSEHVCGVTETSDKTEQFLTKTITSCKVIDLAIANTYDMVTAYGSNTAVENHNLGVLNNVQTNYRSEFVFNVEFNVVAHFFPTNASNNPYTPSTTTTEAITLLNNFRTWAQGPGFAGGGNSGGATGSFGIDYTMATVWTDTNITFGGSSGTVGLAYTPGWHHLLEDYTASAPSLQSMVTHEKGHNFGANHDASGANYIMAPSVTLTEIWSPGSLTAINNVLNAQPYLDDCSTLGAPTAHFHQSAFAICSGSSVEYEDQSQYSATRDWEFLGGSPLTSTEEKPVVTYNTPGLYASKVTSHNAAGSDSYYSYVDVQTAPPSPCTPSGGNGGAGGITNITLAGMSSSSSPSGVLYEDFSCDEVSTLEASTAYNIVIGVTGVNRLRFFVDYNNDGDFLDASESSPTYSFSGSGNLGLTLNTPANPVEGELLRMRVTVSTSTIDADGCTAPSVGQVEDYSVYFEELQVLGCTDPAATNYDPAATVDDGNCDYGGTPTWWYGDVDNDGYGDPSNSTSSVTQPTGFVADDTDCNDNNASVHPGATEVCDGLDNNCNGVTDEGVTSTFYQDNDGDGYGNPSATTQACAAPAGYVANNMDCNDSNAAINPGATENCGDGIDNNCNGMTDEGCPSGPTCDGTHLVINTITQNTYRAEISLQSTATVDSSNDILFVAGSFIELQPGFQVILGTDFEARIEPCSNFAPTPGSTNKINLGDLPEKIQEKFGAKASVKATIYDNNHSKFERTLNTSGIEALVKELGERLEQGTYKLNVSNGKVELIQDILVIK